jgi:hypothetical protein
MLHRLCQGANVISIANDLSGNREQRMFPIVVDTVQTNADGELCGCAAESLLSGDAHLNSKLNIICCRGVQYAGGRRRRR